MTKKLVSIGLVSLIFLLLFYTDPIWTRTPGGLWIPLIFLLIVGLFFWLTFKLIKEVIGLIKNRTVFIWNHSLPSLLILGILCFTFLNTLSIDFEDRIYGKVIFRACYEGTQNQATFKLRENNKFEIHSTAVFFYDEYFTGRYSQRGDTLDLVYDGEIVKSVGTKIFMNNQYQILEPIKNNSDSVRRLLPFYYGYCKGLN